MSATCLDHAPPRHPQGRMRPVRADFCVTQRASRSTGQWVVEAWLVVQGPVGMSRCLVVAEGFDDGFHFGDRPIRSIFSPASPGQWQPVSDTWRWALSAWRGPADGAPAAARWMEGRFAGIRVRAHTLPGASRA